MPRYRPTCSPTDVQLCHENARGSWKQAYSLHYWLAHNQGCDLLILPVDLSLRDAHWHWDGGQSYGSKGRLALSRIALSKICIPLQSFPILYQAQAFALMAGCVPLWHTSLQSLSYRSLKPAPAVNRDNAVGLNPLAASMLTRLCQFIEGLFLNPSHLSETQGTAFPGQAAGGCVQEMFAVPHAL